MKTTLSIRASIAMCFLLRVSFAQPGSLDNTFGISGKTIISLDTFTDQFNALAIQSDQKILFAGITLNGYTKSNFALLRCKTNGSLDSTFGVEGKVSTFIEKGSQANSVAVQSDGKILVGGNSSWFINLARYHSNGNIDSSFGTKGIVITDVSDYYGEKCQSMAIQSDGKILIGGYGQHKTNDKPYFILARYNSDGTLDNSFGTGGIVIGIAGKGHSMALQSDGKILLGGALDYKFKLARYNIDGTLDISFGTGGEVITTVGSSAEANALSIQSDGKILLGGYGYPSGIISGFALVRYNSDGSLDNSFGKDGIVITTIGSFSAISNAMKIQTNGKIVLAGYAFSSSSNYDVAIARYNSNGILDVGFGAGGTVITPIGAPYSYNSANALSIQKDGKIVLGGFTYNAISKTDMLALRYEGDSALGVEKFDLNSKKLGIYPNPSSSFATIQLETSVQDAALSMLNMIGQEVKQIKNINGQEVKIFRENLPCGIYFLRLTEKNKTIYTGKLIINE